jgi:signal transduction histidine kinase
MANAQEQNRHTTYQVWHDARAQLTGRSAPGLEAVPAGNRSDLTAAGRIIAAADEARRRIERDLHDGLQQRLVSLLLRAALAEASVPADRPDLKRDLARIADGLGEALEAVRDIARGIHPAILSEGGLGPAVKALARGSAVPVTVHANLPGRLPERVEAGAYYIVCEALANAAKHARATAVEISLGHRRNALDLSVRDDGIGGADGTGPGLTGLADRVHTLAGTMQLISPPGRGTHLRVSLPTGPGQPD